MEEILRRLSSLRTPTLENVVHVLDIVVVAYLVYRLLALVKGTRAWRILGGIVIFIAALFVSDFLHLRTLHWVLDKAALLLPVAIVLLLLPELRQTLESFARLGLWPDRLPGAAPAATAARTVEEIVAAVAEMAASRTGAIVVIEREANLDAVAENGVSLQAEVSAPLLISLFYGANPLHDGAAIVRNDRLVAAACRLPLSEAVGLDPSLHMRHRAALGITEQTDCLSIVVSEERGAISVALDGRLERLAGPNELRDVLNRELRGARDARPRRKRRERKPVGA